MTTPFSKPDATPDREQNLPWQAFCYVADELDSQSLAAFEERLAVDQQAREAVAAAVELQTALQTVLAAPGLACSLKADASGGKTLQTGCGSNRSRRQVGFLAAAACLMVVGLAGYVWLSAWQAEIAGTALTGPNSELRSTEADIAWPQLALAWSAAHEEVFADEVDYDWQADDDAWAHAFPHSSQPVNSHPAPEQVAGQTDDADEDNDDERASDSLEAPSWMLAALAGAAATNSPEMEN